MYDDGVDSDTKRPRFNGETAPKILDYLISLTAQRYYTQRDIGIR